MTFPPLLTIDELNQSNPCDTTGNYQMTLEGGRKVTMISYSLNDGCNTWGYSIKGVTTFDPNEGKNPTIWFTATLAAEFDTMYCGSDEKTFKECAPLHPQRPMYLAQGKGKGGEPLWVMYFPDTESGEEVCSLSAAHRDYEQMLHAFRYVAVREEFARLHGYDVEITSTMRVR